MDRKAFGSKFRNIVAVLVIASATGAAGFLVGQGNRPPPQPVSPVKTEQVEPPVPSVPVTLGRAEIIALGNQAADAASGGPPIDDLLDGRRFVIRIPFGCGPAAPDGPPRSTAYTMDDGVLRLQVRAQDFSKMPWVAGEVSRNNLLSAEGFWIPRPWTQSETCPSVTNELAERASDLGLVQFFDSDSSRVGQRRGRDLQATVPIDAGADISKGFALVLSGRVARWPGRRETIQCNAAQPADRPVCLVGTKLDSLTLENGATGDVLADWRF